MSWYIILASFFGTIAFSILYNIPPRYWLTCGLIGVIGWIVYAFSLPNIGITFAIFLASVIVTFLSRLSAVRLKTPEIIFLVAGIFTLVPGADIYWTVYYIVSEQLDKALTSGNNALKACLGIVLGILLVHELPQHIFFKLAGGRNVRK